MHKSILRYPTNKFCLSLFSTSVFISASLNSEFGLNLRLPKLISQKEIMNDKNPKIQEIFQKPQRNVICLLPRAYLHQPILISHIPTVFLLEASCLTLASWLHSPSTFWAHCRFYCPILLLTQCFSELFSPSTSLVSRSHEASCSKCFSSTVPSFLEEKLTAKDNGIQWFPLC